MKRRDNVVSIYGGHKINPSQGAHDCHKIAGEIINRTRSNNVTGIAVVMYHHDNTTTRVHAGTYRRQTMIGAVVDLLDDVKEHAVTESDQ